MDWEGWDAGTATKLKKRGSFDDELEDLLGSNDKTSVQSARASQLAGDSSGRAQGSSSQGSKKSFLEDDFFSKLPAEDVAAAGGSSAPGADPPALLQSLKDMDEMDAELLGLSKPSSGPGMMTMKGPGKCDSLGGGVRTAPEKGEPVPVMKKKPLSSPAASQKHKKLSFADLDDPLAGLLSDEEQDAPKKPPPAGTRSSPEEKPKWSKEKEPPQTALHVAASARRRPELTFEDDGEDLLDALGLGRCPEGNEKQEQKAEDREKLRPDHSKLDELLGRGSVAKVLEEPGTGEHEEFQLDKKDPKQPEKEEDWNKEDFVFGAYQPTVATMPRGQPWRRQPVSRFSESGELKAEPSSRAAPAARQSPVRSSGAGGDWLGLKEEDLLPSELPVGKASPAGSQPSPSQLLAAQEAAPKAEPREEEEKEEEEEEDWLSAALARKRALAQAKAQERAAKPSETPGKGLDPPSPASLPAASTAAPQQDKAASTSGSRQPVPWLSTTEGASAAPWEPTKGDPTRDTGALVPTASLLGEQEMQGPAQLAQVAPPPASLQAAPQLQAEPPAPGSLQEGSLGAASAQLCREVSGWQAALLSTQARVAELQSQVQTLELERTQHKLLLESLQQRHQEDLNLLESSYRSQLKVLEETCRQREERLRREREQLEAQLLCQGQEAERARAELLAQHRQSLAALRQQHGQELERLRGLQRVSVEEMRKEHQEQLQWLKRLKEQEVEAVTSAVSHTRSLDGVVEQMEKFSRDLQELSRKMEATQHSTSQELATEARQQGEQLRELQDRLLQQQRKAEEERGRLQETVAKLEARLREQTGLLEQERWRVAMEQARVESLQHSLEEQRRVVAQQLATQRGELERAKGALLEEQQSLVQKGLGEQWRLGGQWGELPTQQQLRRRWWEPGVEEALQMDSQRGGTVLSLAKEQAELETRARELRAKEKQLARDRELLEEARQDLRLEEERVRRAGLRVQQREEELRIAAELSSRRYEEEERALREAGGRGPEQQPRLRGSRSRLEQLRQQEEQLHQERLSVARQRRQLEQLCRELASLPGQQDPGAPPRGLSSSYLSAPGRSTELCSTLLLLKHRAQQDHCFLEDEQLFLETLNKESYKTSLSG